MKSSKECWLLVHVLVCGWNEVFGLNPHVNLHLDICINNFWLCVFKILIAQDLLPFTKPKKKKKKKKT